jgi:hypothetical protein
MRHRGGKATWPTGPLAIDIVLTIRIRRSYLMNAMSLSPAVPGTEQRHDAFGSDGLGSAARRVLRRCCRRGHTAALEDRAEYRETIGQAIEIGVAVVQLLHQFLDTDRTSEVVLGRTLDRPGGVGDEPDGGSAKSWRQDLRNEGGRKREMLRQDKKSPHVRRKSALPLGKS